MIKIEMRRRSDPSDDVAALHAHLVQGLTELIPNWWNAGATINEPDLDNGLESQVNLGPGLPDNAQGYVAYVFRDANYSRDLAEFDDRLVLDIRVASKEYREAVNELFPSLVRVFEPYRASIILDEDLALDDWESANERGRQTGKDEDGRDGVIRIPPVGFFDNAFCLRVFGLDDGEFARRLDGVAEKTLRLNDGIFFVFSMEMLDRKQLVDLDQRVRSELSVA
ncbi:MAG: hypothetical protein R3C53_14925 [Pirellulaceae bacterium]